MRISMLGTRGVPARYGGFETAVEEIGARLVARGHEVLVYCRNAGQDLHSYRGMALHNVPAIRLNSAETLSSTAAAVVHVLRHGSDVALVFNMANAPLLPALSVKGIPVALHVDGMEWQRGKWDGLGRHYYRMAERLGVKLADELIADSGGIAAYYREKYGVFARQIAYGAEIHSFPSTGELAIPGVSMRQYHLIVSRWVPENNLHVIMQGYARSAARYPLLVVGDATYGGPYADLLREIAASDDRIQLLGALYDQDLLNRLYAGALSYLHGHSVGGTNPSLLRAMGCAAPVLAYDVVYNREVLAETGGFFRSAEDVCLQVQRYEADTSGARQRAHAGQERVARLYTWDLVAGQYEALCVDLLRLRGRSLSDYAHAFGLRRDGRRFARYQ